MVIKSNPSYTDYFNFCDGEKYYKVALILVISWILWSPTKRFTREELSKRFYKRYSALNTTISFQDWDSKVASAINVCCKFRKVLEKQRKGITSLKFLYKAIYYLKEFLLPDYL